MSDPYGPPTLGDAATASAGTAPAQPPGPGFFESIGLGFKRGGVQEDWGLNQTNYESTAYDSLYKGLTQRGYRLPRVPVDQFRAISARSDADAAVVGYPEQIAATRAFWQALKTERQRDPKFAPDFGDVGDYPSLLTHIARVRNESLQRLDGQAANGSTIGSVIGQIGYGAGDPINFTVGGRVAATARGTSAARLILSAALRDAATNAGLVTVEEPFIRQDAASLGHARSVTDYLESVGVAVGTGGVFGATFKGVHLGGGAIRERMRSAGTAPDRAAVAALDQAVPPDMRTPDEQAAAHVLTRAADVAESSPFVASPAGDDAHAASLDAMLDAVTAHPAPSSSPAAGVEARPPVTRSALLAGTADPSTLRTPAREQVKARIRQAESGGNDNGPPNPRSSARGRYGFTDPTWRSYYIRRYGRQGLSDAEIVAKRSDPALTELLMNDLVADNARSLKNAGQPETAGSLYLLHFAGEKGGLHVLGAAAETPLERILSPAAMEANPFLHGKSAGWLVAWADRKMGGRVGETAAVEGAGAAPDAPAADVPPLPDAVPVMADREASEDWLGLGESPALRPELFDGAEAHARAQLLFDRDRDARDGFTWIEHDSEAAPGEPVAADAGGLEAALAEEPKLAPARRQRAAAPRSLLQFLRARGGIDDVRGDFASMGAGPMRWADGTPVVIGKKGVTKLLRERNPMTPRGQAESKDHAPDAAFAAAIDEGYFPQYEGQRRGDFTYDDLPEMSVFHEAVDQELRGRPLYRLEDVDPAAAAQARQRRMQPGEEEAWHILADRIEQDWGVEGLVERGDHELRDLVMRLHGEGEEPTVAWGSAVERLAETRLRDAAHETGTIEHDIPGFDDEGSTKGGTDLAAADGGGRSGGEPGDAREAGDILAPGEGAPESRTGPLDLAVDAAEAQRLVDSGDFSDPAGKEAHAQAQSLEHDLRMEDARVFHGGRQIEGEPRVPFFVSKDRNVAGAYAMDREGAGGVVTAYEINPKRMASPQDVEAAAKAIGVSLEGDTHGMNINEGALADELVRRGFDSARIPDVAPNADAPIETIAVLDPSIVKPAAEPAYRVTEDGEAKDVAALLDALDDEDRAADTIRSCMAPPKGPGE